MAEYFELLTEISDWMHTVKNACQTVMCRIKFEYPMIMTKETETQIYFLAAVSRSQVQLYTPEDFHSTIVLVKVKVKRMSLECELSLSLSCIMHKLVASHSARLSRFP